MNIRAKFVLVAITEHNWSPTLKTLRFQCQYDTTIPEDQRFFDATPTGHIEINVNNPVALENFKLGQAYYADFTPVGDVA